MKKNTRIFVFVGLIAGVLSACGTTVTPQNEELSFTSSDVQAIQNLLVFDDNRQLALKDGAEKILTPQQLDFARHGLEVSNYMVEQGLMKYTSKPDGTMLDMSINENDLTAQGICDNKIDSVSWINRSGVWSASNKPTTCGKWIGNHFNSWDAWVESYKQTPSSSHWNKVSGTNTYWSMYNQFECHFLVVRGTKTPWNLEPSRPNVGYARTVAAGCNPGGGSD